jgi:hypothetical protein
MGVQDLCNGSSRVAYVASDFGGLGQFLMQLFMLPFQG